MLTAPVLVRPPRGLAADQSGVAAVEFAFVAPIAILLFLGVAQLSLAMVASRHANHAASSLGDLVSQCASINDTDLTNVFSAAKDIMNPLPTGATILGQRVTSVMVTDTNQTTLAQWSQASDPSSLTTSYGPGAAVVLPSNIVSAKGDSVLVAETVYKYTFPFTTGGLLPIGQGQNVSLAFGQALTFDNRTYFKPRKSAIVTYTGTGVGGTGSSSGVQGQSCYGS